MNLTLRKELERCGEDELEAVLKVVRGKLARKRNLYPPGVHVVEIADRYRYEYYLDREFNGVSCRSGKIIETNYDEGKSLIEGGYRNRVTDTWVVTRCWRPWECIDLRSSPPKKEGK